MYIIIMYYTVLYHIELYRFLLYYTVLIRQQRKISTKIEENVDKSLIKDCGETKLPDTVIKTLRRELLSRRDSE